MREQKAKLHEGQVKNKYKFDAVTVNLHLANYKMEILCVNHTSLSYILLIVWLSTIGVFWFSKSLMSKNIESQSRYFIYYVLVSGIILLSWRGEDFFSDTYLANVITELIGIFITVVLIDRIYKFISAKNEELYRKLALKTCRMPIYTYCANWLYIYQSDNKELNDALSKHESLEKFFLSDEFYDRICSFDFNGSIAIDKSYAQYYYEKINDITDRFQNILVKYASKLSHKDIPLLEHFGGRAHILSTFSLMKFINEANFTSQLGNQPAKRIVPFNNSFKDIKRENFQKHFRKLIELINEYNTVVDNDYEKWTIQNIARLHTTKSANENPSIEW